MRLPSLMQNQDYYLNRMNQPWFPLVDSSYSNCSLEINKDTSTYIFIEEDCKRKNEMSADPTSLIKNITFLSEFPSDVQRVNLYNSVAAMVFALHVTIGSGRHIVPNPDLNISNMKSHLDQQWYLPSIQFGNPWAQLVPSFSRFHNGHIINLAFSFSSFKLYQKTSRNKSAHLSVSTKLRLLP